MAAPGAEQELLAAAAGEGKPRISLDISVDRSHPKASEEYAGLTVAALKRELNNGSGGAYVLVDSPSGMHLTVRVLAIKYMQGILDKVNCFVRMQVRDKNDLILWQKAESAESGFILPKVAEEVAVKLNAALQAFFAQDVAEARRVVASRSAKRLSATGRAAGQVVAVFNVEDRGAGLSEEALERLSEYLASAIAASGAFQVIPRSQLKERLTDQKKESFKACYDQSCQIELGRELAAQKSLSTQIIKFGPMCSVTAVLYDLKRSASEGGAREDGGCEEDKLIGSVQKVVGKLIAP